MNKLTDAEREHVKLIAITHGPAAARREIGRLMASKLTWADFLPVVGHVVIRALFVGGAIGGLAYLLGRWL